MRFPCFGCNYGEAVCQLQPCRHLLCLDCLTLNHIAVKFQGRRTCPVRQCLFFIEKWAVRELEGSTYTQEELQASFHQKFDYEERRRFVLRVKAQLAVLERIDEEEEAMAKEGLTREDILRQSKVDPKELKGSPYDHWNWLEITGKRMMELKSAACEETAEILPKIYKDSSLLYQPEFPISLSWEPKKDPEYSPTMRAVLVEAADRPKSMYSWIYYVKRFKIMFEDFEPAGSDQAAALPMVWADKPEFIYPFSSIFWNPDDKEHPLNRAKDAPKSEPEYTREQISKMRKELCMEKVGFEPEIPYKPRFLRTAEDYPQDTLDSEDPYNTNKLVLRSPEKKKAIKGACEKCSRHSVETSCTDYYRWKTSKKRGNCMKLRTLELEKKHLIVMNSPIARAFINLRFKDVFFEEDNITRKYRWMYSELPFQTDRVGINSTTSKAPEKQVASSTMAPKPNSLGPCDYSYAISSFNSYLKRKQDTVGKLVAFNGNVEEILEKWYTELREESKFFQVNVPDLKAVRLFQYQPGYPELEVSLPEAVSIKEGAKIDLCGTQYILTDKSLNSKRRVYRFSFNVCQDYKAIGTNQLITRLEGELNEFANLMAKQEPAKFYLQWPYVDSNLRLESSNQFWRAGLDKFKLVEDLIKDNCSCPLVLKEVWRIKASQEQYSRFVEEAARYCDGNPEEASNKLLWVSKVFRSRDEAHFFGLNGFDEENYPPELEKSPWSLKFLDPMSRSLFSTEEHWSSNPEPSKKVYLSETLPDTAAFPLHKEVYLIGVLIGFSKEDEPFGEIDLITYGRCTLPVCLAAVQRPSREPAAVCPQKQEASILKKHLPKDYFFEKE